MTDIYESLDLYMSYNRELCSSNNIYTYMTQCMVISTVIVVILVIKVIVWSVSNQLVSEYAFWFTLFKDVYRNIYKSESYVIVPKLHI